MVTKQGMQLLIAVWITTVIAGCTRYCQKLWITAARTAVSAAARRSRTARLSRPFISNC